MLANLLASARELRSPLVVGYSALFTAWLFLRNELATATTGSSLGADIKRGIADLGGAGELALITFAAAMLGSLIWNLAIARLVATLKRLFDHPDWDTWIERAQRTVKQYEEYKVTTHKGAHTGKPSPFDAQHRVPSPLWALHLQAEVEDRRRKASEVDFRITLAISLLPVAVALSLQGGGYWWLSFSLPAAILFDVSITKHTTAELLIDYEISDSEERLNSLQTLLNQSQNSPPQQQEDLRLQIATLEKEMTALRDKRIRRSARAFRWIRGSPRLN